MFQGSSFMAFKRWSVIKSEQRNMSEHESKVILKPTREKPSQPEVIRVVITILMIIQHKYLYVLVQVPYLFQSLQIKEIQPNASSQTTRRQS